MRTPVNKEYKLYSNNVNAYFKNIFTGNNKVNSFTTAVPTVGGIIILAAIAAVFLRQSGCCL